MCLVGKNLVRRSQPGSTPKTNGFRANPVNSRLFDGVYNFTIVFVFLKKTRLYFILNALHMPARIIIVFSSNINPYGVFVSMDGPEPGPAGSAQIRSFSLPKLMVS